MTEKLEKTEQEWREELAPERFHILREKGTEPPFTGAYTYSKDDGVYRCGACGNELFSSDAKFDSGTGWPSFTEPAFADAVELHEDRSLGMTRTEVTCAPLRQPPGPRVPGRPGPRRPALLHQLAVAGAGRERLALEHGQVEPAEANRVGEDVHRRDPATPDREAADGEALPVPHGDESHRAVHEHRVELEPDP